MKNLRLPFVCLLVCSLLFNTSLAVAQSSLIQSWVKRVDFRQAPDESLDIAADSLGNSYATGHICTVPQSPNPSGSSGCFQSEALTIKYAPNGTVLWKAFLSGPQIPSPFPDSASAKLAFADGEKVAVDSMGNAYVSGRVILTRQKSANPSGLLTANREEIWTAKYDVNGNREWISFFDDSLHGYKSVAGIAVDHNGNVITSGSGFVSDPEANLQGPAHFLTIKYDSQGKQIWAEAAPFGSFGDAARDMKLDPAGNIIVAGSGIGNGSGVILKYCSTGSLLWSDVFGIGESYRALIVDAEGNAFVAGNMVVKYGPAGNRAWVASHTTPNSNTPPFYQTIGLDSSGNVYVAGTASFIDGNKYDTLKFSPTGTFLWEELYSNNGIGVIHQARVLLVCSSGIFVTGRSFNAEGGFEVATIKYSATGTQLRAVRYTLIPLGDSQPNAMAFGGAALFVTGSSAGTTTDLDWITIKYINP